VRRPVRGVPLLFVASVVALALVGVFIRSFSAAESGGRASPVLEIVAFVLGVWVPLFALIYACVRSRVAVVALAFCVGLSVNVVFLTHAIPTAAVTDNSSVFTFENSTTFSAPTSNMRQNYTPSGASTTCSLARASCIYSSDTFSTGQTINAGTSVADLYLTNTAPTITYRGGLAFSFDAIGCTAWRPQTAAEVAMGDVYIAACAFRGGASVTITPPDGTWIPLTRVDSGANLSIATFYHVVTSPSTEWGGSVNFALGSVQKGVGALSSFSGVDTTNPVDQQNGQLTASGTSHTALGVTTTAANDILLTFHAVVGSTGATNQWTPPPGMSERFDAASDTNGAATNLGMGGNELLLGAAGATGNKTATSAASGAGATKTIALRAATTCTVTTTLSKVTPMTLRASTTKTVVSGTSIVMDTPAGTQQNDLMLVSIGFTGTGSVTAAAGWTAVTTWPFGQPAIQLNTYRRTAGSSEPASYTWTVSAAAAIVGWQGSYIGGDTASPQDAVAGNQNTTGTTHTTGSLTTTRANDLILGIYALNATATFSTPTGMSAQGTATGATGITLAVFDATQPAIGTFGPKTSTSSVTGTGANSMPSFKSGAASVTTLGSATTTLGAVGSPTLQSVSISTSATTFGDGDRLQLVVDGGSSCNASLSYDGAAQPSKLTVATNVPEGVVGLLFLAPALPVGLRWWKRRRP
jgi:hypothetical protein